MIILARLNRSAVSLFAHALAPDHEVRHAGSWSDVVAALPAGDVGVVVFDPAADPPGMADLGRLLAFGVPAVTYVDLNARGVRATLQLAPLGVRDLVIRGVEDDPESIRRIVEGVAGTAYGDRLVARLAEEGVRLPEPLWRALRALFRRPQDFVSVAALSSAAGLTRRSLDRRLEQQGLATASDLLAIARALLAYRMLRESSDPVYAVARRLGYRMARQLARQFAVVTNMPPSMIRNALPPDRFLELVAGVLRGRARTRAPTSPRPYARSA